MEQIENLITQALELGPGPFTVVAVIGFGYVLRGITWFKNDWIPPVNHVIGTATYIALQYTRVKPEEELASFFIRSFFVGLIISYAAWKFHENIVAGIEDKIPFSKGWINRGQPTPGVPAAVTNKP